MAERPTHNLPRLFLDAPLGLNQPVTCPDSAAHYLARVMRLQAGDAVVLFNGVDGEWLAELTSADRKHVQLSCQRQLRAQQTEPDLWLCFAPIKPGHMEFLVQKATELGVSRLQPVLTDRTVARHPNLEKMHAHAREAAEQSERLNLPTIPDMQRLPKLLDGWDASRLLLVADEYGAGLPLGQLAQDISPQQPLALLTGPEGGFTPAEHEMLRDKNFIRLVTLGPRILRADTAALAGLACLQSLWGDWQHPPRVHHLSS
jgi:16S rRNA (uracil1498-N3)-methyltransferase